MTFLRRYLWFDPPCELVHPWLEDGVLVARTAVLSATFFWALLVLGINDSWMLYEYAHLKMVAPEDAWGATFLGLSLVQIVRTYTKRPPSIFGFVLNASFAYLWTYVSINRFVSDQYVPIAGFVACILIMLASWWNLISLPKKETWNGSKYPFVG